MKARVRKILEGGTPNKWDTTVACGGKVFNKTDWLEVPQGREDEARQNEYLELQEDALVAKEPVPTEPQAEVKTAEVVTEPAGATDPEAAEVAGEGVDSPRGRHRKA